MSVRKEVFEKLAERASQLFGKSADSFSDATRFVEDCGIKSVQVSQITTFLEDEFDTEIPYMDFRRKSTFGEAVDYVVSECLGEPLDDEGESAPAAAPAPAAPEAASETETQKKVLAALAERASGLFGVPASEVTRNKSFADDFGIKSVQVSQITTYLEDEFDIEIPYMDFRRKETVGEAVDYIVKDLLGEEIGESSAPAAEAPKAAEDSMAAQSAKSDHDDELAMRERFTLKETFQGEELEAIYMVARKPSSVDPSVDLAASEDPMARMGQGFCPAFNQRTYEAAPGVMCDQDVPVKMRDGVTIYCDVFRPADTSQKYPAIVSWSWFGKRPGEGMSEWQIMGVPPHTVSKLAKFESPDPLYW